MNTLQGKIQAEWSREKDRRAREHERGDLGEDRMKNTFWQWMEVEWIGQDLVEEPKEGISKSDRKGDLEGFF